MSENESVSEEAAIAELVTLVVDHDVCIGIGRCEVIEPDSFAVNDDAVAEVVGDARFPRERAKEIMDECPSGAISIADSPT